MSRPLEVQVINDREGQDARIGEGFRAKEAEEPMRFDT